MSENKTKHFLGELLHSLPQRLAEASCHAAFRAHAKGSVCSMPQCQQCPGFHCALKLVAQRGSHFTPQILTHTLFCIFWDVFFLSVLFLLIFFGSFGSSLKSLFSAFSFFPSLDYQCFENKFKKKWEENFSLQTKIILPCLFCFHFVLGSGMYVHKGHAGDARNLIQG